MSGLNVESVDQALATYSPTDAAIAELKERYLPLQIEGVDDKAGLMRVHNARMEIRGMRVQVEKTRKELVADALDYQRKVNARAKDITASLLEIEEPLKAREDEITAEKERIKAEAEAKRRARLDARLQQAVAVGWTPSVAELAEMDDDAFARSLKLATEKHEAAERERLEREAQEKAERERLEAEAEKARQEAQERAEREMAEAAERERVERERLAEERRKLDEERAAMQREQDRMAEERARLDREAAERRAAEEAAQAEREEQERRRREEAEQLKHAEEMKRRQEALRSVREQIDAYVQRLSEVELPDVLKAHEGAVSTYLAALSNTLVEFVELRATRDEA